MKYYITLSLLLLSSITYGQQGINWNKYFIKGSLAVGKLQYNLADSAAYAQNCAWLEIGRDTTTRGMIIPRVLNAGGINNPVKGLIAYDLTENAIKLYDGTGWTGIGSGGGSVGNAGYGLGKTGSTFYVDTTVIVNVNYLDAQSYATEAYVDNAIASIDSFKYTPRSLRLSYYGPVYDNYAINRAIADAHLYNIPEVDASGVICTLHNTVMLDTGMAFNSNRSVTLRGMTAIIADEETTSLAVAVDSGATYLVVDSIPNPQYWHAGSWLQVYTTDHGNATIRNRPITHINGDTVFIGKIMPGDFPAGTIVRRVFTGITYGMYGADIITDIDTAGRIHINEHGDTLQVRARLQGCYIDGNKDNRSGNLGWTANSTIEAAGMDIVQNVFVDIPNENIVGDGNYVVDNYAYDLNGSFYHQGNSLQSHNLRKYKTAIENNNTDGTNLEAAKNQHGDAVVTYSFAAQGMNIHHNHFKNGGLCMNYFQSSVDVGYVPPKNNNISHNTYENFGSISTPSPPFILEDAPILEKGGDIHVTGNHFINCGTNDWSNLNYDKGNAFLPIYWVSNAYTNTSLLLPKHWVIKTDYNGTVWDANRQGLDFVHGATVNDSNLSQSARFEADGDIRFGWYGAANAGQVVMAKTNAAHTGVLTLADRVTNRVTIFAVDSTLTGNQFWRLNLGGFSSNTLGYKEEFADSSILKRKNGTVLRNINTKGEYTTAKDNMRPMFVFENDLGTADWNTLTKPGTGDGFILGAGLGPNNPNISSYYIPWAMAGYPGDTTQIFWPMQINALPHNPLLRYKYNGTTWTGYYQMLASGNPLITPQKTVTNGNTNADRWSSIIYCNTSGANDTITLRGTSAGVYANTIYWIKKQTAANSVVLKPETGNINGNALYSFTDTTCPVLVQYDGTNYKIVSYDCGSYAKTGHIHDDRYYTESEVDGLIAPLATQAALDVKVDSVTVSNDSLYEWKNGVAAFRYLYSAGGGGSGTVTNVAATDGSGFDFTITNPTTTPNISLALQADNNFVTDAEKTVIGNTSGTNTGDQTITLTGDVTGTGTGTFATTIATGAVTNAKVASGIDAAKIGAGSVDNVELSYLNGATSSVQGQLNNKMPTLNIVSATDASVAFGLTEGIDIVANTTGSTNFPAEIGVNVHFATGLGGSGSSYNRDFDLFHENASDNYYFSRYDGTGTRMGTYRILLNKDTATLATDYENSLKLNSVDTASLSARIDAKGNKLLLTNQQTGTSYTILSSDLGKIIEFNNGSAITCTLPSGLGDGFWCIIKQAGAGQVTLSASGTTIHNRQAFTKTKGQYASFVITHENATETYTTQGDME